MTTDTSTYGILTDYTTGDQIRPATRDELHASLDAGYEGVIEVAGQAVFVDGGDEDAE